MAGGKETPRQKMVGLMYLVLLAMLALQISNAVLEKFAIIESTLVEMIHEGNNKNTQTLNAIIKEAGKSQNSKVVHAKENAQKVRELTQTTLASIDKLKKTMIEMAGTDKVDEKLINDHSSKIAVMMISQPEGKNFEKLLTDYVTKLRELSGLSEKEIGKLAKSPKDMSIFAGDPDHANKDFLTFTFENTPAIAALASVTQIQTEILEHETKALDKLLSDAGVGKVSFDNIVPMVRAKQSIVAAGSTYEADLFISASSSSFVPEMYKDGQKLDLFDDATGVKMGRIKFTAQGGAYDATGMAKKKYTTQIKLPDTTLTQEIEYFVAQPVIRVTTGNAPTLYMNCGNNVNIEVPTLGTNYNPTFTSQGAEVRKGDKPGKVTIIPSSRKVTVGVSNSGSFIGNQVFDAKNIPEPRFVAYVGNSPVDLRQGIKPNQIRSLRIVIEPDENFKEEVPKDARYSIKNMEVTMGSGPVAKAQTRANNGSPDLGAWTGQAKAGDRIVFVIRDAVRKTFTDSEEKVGIKGSNGVIFVPIN
ncbi:gliding motility protein GldM [Chryseosolibacter indicus]|uniref:Gliding motility protein GldM n=1 Tax=Chryseosolibacter indicus TaxID=2782351 RepID=A0ABS5VRN7_9BACT|nr:gliding motility protein GldM [Chryseosolibacter indicus]MBT1702676.1 gliding motility protein GldM [Chryseosolibacter indicus]